MRQRINISLEPATVEKLKELAESSHMNVSQWITQAVWKDDGKYKKQKRTVKKNG
jgi:predicted transcriptional regulator